ncbi:MAG TPA: hypothetical protein VGQ38_12210 [Gaiellaceae bacterium]|nr:hypothetical protein [Gaiellaceae bacterium]
MFIILLTFKDRSRIAEWRDAHVEWLVQGFDDGVFVLSGSVHAELDDDPGGVILATGISAEELGPRIDADPFVRHSVADATILRVEPSKTDERLSFLAAVA